MEESEKEEKLKKVALEVIDSMSTIFDDNKKDDTLESEDTSDGKSITKTSNKASLKDYIVASIFVIAIVALFTWGFSNEVKYNTEQNNFFLLFIGVLIAYFGFVAIKSLDFKPKSKNSVFKEIFFFDLPKSEEGRIETYLFIFIGIPIALALLGLLLTLLIILVNNLFWVLAIYLIATCIQFFRYAKNAFLKILTVVLLCTVLYAGYNARHILNINFKVEFNDKVIFP
ncbi:hypothetical protein [Flagellimonas marinaquae]|uniref:hypothetical protein n=1 Tax=Flagellimonas marinaquae TaxID=254955 RepID=UPI000F8C91D1|nr:hypothetical protein [Allomuricauda aquimarina]